MQVALSSIAFPNTNRNSMMFLSLILCIFLTTSVQLSIQVSIAAKDLQNNTNTDTSTFLQTTKDEGSSSSNSGTAKNSPNKTVISNSARDPKYLSLFQNLLLRLPLHLSPSPAQNQYQYHTTAAESASQSQQHENQYYKQELLQQPSHHQQQQQQHSYTDYDQQQSPSSSSNAFNTLNTNQLNGQTVPKFAFGDLTDLSSIANFLSFGTMEAVIERVNKFDQLKCIPKIMCQMTKKRQEDAERDATSTTTTTRKPSSRDTSSKEDAKSPESKEKKKETTKNARFIKFQGVDTALQQIVKFLDVMQLKDWSLYPYLKGIHDGHEVERSDDCIRKYSTCPFNDDQLVYYFNNYNGGFFQSFRSNRQLPTHPENPEASQKESSH